MVNKTPVCWYHKKQINVDTATCGYEFVSDFTFVGQIIYLSNTLRSLGVPILEKNYKFEDKKSSVDSAINPHAKLHKHHTAISFHQVHYYV